MHAPSHDCSGINIYNRSMVLMLTEIADVELRIHELVGDVHNLPTPPVVFTQISRVIDDENASAYDVAGIISEDPAMSAQVLKLSNSAFYGLAHPVANVKQAVMVLGLNEVKNVVLSASVISAFSKSAANTEYQDEFWRHSLAVAVTARTLIRSGRVEKLPEAEAAFSAGLLHDIGKMVILCYASEEHKKIQDHLAELGGTARPAEIKVMGLDHCQIGEYLASSWKLPAEVLEAVSFHHTPKAAPDTGTYATATHVADFLAHLTFDHQEDDAEPVEMPEAECLERFGFSGDDFDALKAVIIEEYAKSETFLQMALG